MEKKHLIIADDDTNTIDEVSYILQQVNFTVQPAKNFDEIKAAATNQQPDCIIANAELTSESGYLLCKKLKGDNELGTTAVLLTSSAEKADDDFKKHAKLKQPADAYLKKPIAEIELLEAIINTVGLPDITPANIQTDDGAEKNQAANLVEQEKLNTQLAKQVEKQKIEIEALSLDNKDLKGKVSQLPTMEQTKQQLTDQLAKVKDELKNHQNSVTKQKKDQEAIAKKLKDTEAHLLKLKATSGEAEKKHKLAQEKLRQFYKEKLEASQKMIKSSSTANQQELDKFKERIKALRTEVKNAVDDLKKAEDKLVEEKKLREKITSMLKE